MKTLRPLLFLVSLLLIVGLATGCRSNQQTDANGPKALVEQPTATAAPTDTPAPQTKGGKAQSFFSEEFDNPLSGDWTSFMIFDEKVSDPEAVSAQAGNGKLSWNVDTKKLAHYMLYKAFSYQDVKLEVSYDNRGVNSNGVKLICRYTANVGWYEFDVTNSGLYSMWAMEILPDGKYVYNRIANGGSLAIKQGKGVNEFSATCQGDKFTLYINGEKVTTATDTKLSLREGQIGIGVASTDVVPVTVDLEWLKVTEP